MCVEVRVGVSSLSSTTMWVLKATRLGSKLLYPLSQPTPPLFWWWCWELNLAQALTQAPHVTTVLYSLPSVYVCAHVYLCGGQRSVSIQCLFRPLSTCLFENFSGVLLTLTASTQRAEGTPENPISNHHHPSTERTEARLYTCPRPWDLGPKLRSSCIHSKCVIN